MATVPGAVGHTRIWDGKFSFASVLKGCAVKAYYFDSPATGLVAVELPDPVAGPGQVVLEVKAAGLCHSDVHILHGEGDGWLRKRPVVLGHEIAGTVVALGPQVANIAVGDRVAVGLIAQPVELADFANLPGAGYDGGYAERTVVPAANLVRIPDAVPFTHAAVATDSIATAYHAVVAESGIDSDSTVVIVGMGGLGLNAVRIAALQGATVLGVDVEEGVFAAAKANGATACYRSISEIPDSIDVVIDFAGMGSTTAEAIATVRAGGRIVIVGLGVQEANLPTGLIITKGIALKGSLGATLDELQAVFALLADGSLAPEVEEIPFGDLAAALRRLEQGGVRGRLVTCPSS